MESKYHHFYSPSELMDGLLTSQNQKPKPNSPVSRASLWIMMSELGQISGSCCQFTENIEHCKTG